MQALIPLQWQLEDVARRTLVRHHCWDGALQWTFGKVGWDRLLLWARERVRVHLESSIEYCLLVRCCSSPGLDLEAHGVVM
jgi:hypothetical protein